MPRADNDEQQPGRWDSNRFIIILAGIVIGVVLANFISGWFGSERQGQLQTPSGSSKNQPADRPPHGSQ